MQDFVHQQYYLQSKWYTATKPWHDIPWNPDWFMTGSLFHGFWNDPYFTWIIPCITPSELTWQWKILIFNREYIASTVYQRVTAYTSSGYSPLVTAQLGSPHPRICLPKQPAVSPLGPLFSPSRLWLCSRESGIWIIQLIGDYYFNSRLDFQGTLFSKTKG